MLKSLKKELGIKTRTPGAFHTFVALRLLEKRSDNNSNIMKRKEAIIIMCNTCFIPKRIFESFLKEMECFGLVKIINKQNIEIMIKEDG